MIDWRGFWEGRVSSKRSLHLRHGLHDQRLEYSIDVELAWRLRHHGLEVVYHPAARSVMSRPIDFDEFCRRYEAKGRAQAAIASLHDDPAIREYTKVEDAARALGGGAARAAAAEGAHPGARAGAAARRGNGAAPATAQRMRWPSCTGATARCSSPTTRRGSPMCWVRRRRGLARAPPAPPANGISMPAPSVNGSDAGDDEAPELSIVVPVWSRTPELADMAERTIERVWEVARLSTEVIVIDNGSPVERPLPARVHRFPENRGVATAWNTGIQLARAPVIAVLNSDCLVEPGWDEALYEAATTGRRIAFPYTDHCDGEGFRQPDQAGTAGWCFMLTRELYAEIGPFDERFNPAYGEDTDYWHRAWELGVELSPVPAARVTHARRSSVARGRPRRLAAARRIATSTAGSTGSIRCAAPPYYNREIVEYHCTQSEPSEASTT